MDEIIRNYCAAASLLFNELILTISFAVAASLAIALASRLLPAGAASGARFEPLRWFHDRFEDATLSYGQLLVQVARWRVLAIALALSLLGGGGLWLGQQLPQEILPQINTGQAELRVQFPPGTSLEENRRAMAAVDEILLAQPETEYAFTTSGGGLFGSNVSENLLRGSSTITLKPGSDVLAFTERTSAALEALNLVNVRLRLSPGRVRGIILSNSPLRGADIHRGAAAGRAASPAGSGRGRNPSALPARRRPAVARAADCPGLAALGGFGLDC